MGGGHHIVSGYWSDYRVVYRREKKCCRERRGFIRGNFQIKLSVADKGLNRPSGCMYVCMYVRSYMYMYVLLDVCMYVCVYVRLYMYI